MFNFGRGFCCTPSRAREKLTQTVGQSKTRAVGEIPLGKERKKPLITPVVEGVDFCKRFADQVPDFSVR